MLERRRITLPEITLAAVDEGSGPPVLLLHGFPDSALVWHEQVAALAAAGFRVIAPDLRGFGESDAPGPVAAYAVDRVVADLLALLDALGVTEPVHLVGHDWGALIGWLLAMRAPERVRSLAALSVGHPEAFRRAGPAQRLKSWYMLAFQLEGLAERLVAARDFRFLTRVAPSEEDAQRWRSDLARPGRLRAGLNWYRANLRLLARGDFPPVQVPVFGIVSDRDPALTTAQMAGSERYVDGPWRYLCLKKTGHWLQIERAERVNAELSDWLRSNDRQ